MTRTLKTSGFLGLATMMVVGLYQYMLLAGGQGVPSWLIGGHAHLGVLSILAIVVGFVIDAYAFTDRLRPAVAGLYVVGQWGFPLTIWLGAGAGMAFLMPTSFLWGLCLIVAMLLMARHALSGLPEQTTVCTLSCIQHDTQYKVLTALCDAIVDGEFTTGYHTAQLYTALTHALADEDLVLVLDDIEFLLLNDGSDLLYVLSRLDSRISHGL